MCNGSGEGFLTGSLAIFVFLFYCSKVAAQHSRTDSEGDAIAKWRCGEPDCETGCERNEVASGANRIAKWRVERAGLRTERSGEWGEPECERGDGANLIAIANKAANRDEDETGMLLRIGLRVEIRLRFKRMRLRFKRMRLRFKRMRLRFKIMRTDSR